MTCPEEEVHVVNFILSYPLFLQIFYYGNGKGFPSEMYKERVHFIGDLNKKDASIQLFQAQFQDNGTYFCDVKNPPDVSGTPSRTELKVVLRGKYSLWCGIG